MWTLIITIFVILVSIYWKRALEKQDAYGRKHREIIEEEKKAIETAKNPIVIARKAIEDAGHLLGIENLGVWGTS